MTTKKLVPPDGGWGYVIVCAYALNHFVSIPIMQGFGLLYKDTFTALGFSATDCSFIMNTNSAFSMFCGLINGPLLKRFGFRKVSICGAILTTSGVIMTAYATTFTQFMITYGLIASLGMGMGMSSYPLALNTYFLKKRSKAAGYTMTICGLGPVVMPQLISLLLYVYGIKGAVTIIGAIAGHTMVSALLLQPVKWHMVEEILDEEDLNDAKAITRDEDGGTALLQKGNVEDVPRLYDRKAAQSALSLNRDLEVEAIYGIDTPLAGSVLSLYPVQRTFSHKTPLNINWWSEESMNTVHLNSSLKIFDENEKSKTMYAVAEESDNEDKLHSTKANGPANNVYNPDMTVEKKKVSLMGRILRSIVDTFDLTLLKDPTYVNIMIGMSLAVYAELNFSLLTPFIMADFNLDTQQIATFMSVISIADICFRFLAPYIGDFLNKPHRVMYLLSLFLLILTRFCLLLTESYIPLLIVACGLGIAKGVRTVFWTLVIPSHVPIERLASATGLQFMVNGIFLSIGGPALGIIRDVTGSYKNCIFVINFVTFTTITLWTIELTYKRYKSKKT